MQAEQLTDPITFHGEGAVWSESWGGLKLVDMFAGDVLSLGSDGSVARLRTGSPIAALVRPRAAGGMVIATERAFSLWSASGVLEWESPPALAEGFRFNEGTCDPFGRLLCGSLAYGFAEGSGTMYRVSPAAATPAPATPAAASSSPATPAAATPAAATPAAATPAAATPAAATALAPSVSASDSPPAASTTSTPHPASAATPPRASVTPLFGGLTISNGLGFTADGTRAFYADTPTRRIDVFDVVDGELTDRRPWAPIAEGAGNPDGLCVDAEGGVWVALYGGSAVHHYDPAGVLADVVTLPASNVTSCTLGGPALSTLFITTSRENLPADAEPLAGAVFTAPAGVAGLPILPFAG